MKLTERPAYSWKTDAGVPDFEAKAHFTVMDAQCGLCAKGATWIARKDTAQAFTIIPLQSQVGDALMRHYGLDPNDPASWLYVAEGRAFTSLDAFIRTGRKVGGTGHLLTGLRILPRFVQDWLYGCVARNRYRFFGRTDMCALPDPQVQKRLLKP